MHTAHHPLLAIALLTLTACDEKDGAVTEDTSEPAFEPDAGTYTITTTDTQSGCQLPDEWDIGSDDISNFVLDDIDAMGFTLTLDDNIRTVYSCSWDEELAFTCPEIVIYTEDLAELNMDAVVYFTGTVDGTFSDTSSNTSTQTIEVSCEGDSCYHLTNFGYPLPCTMDISYDAVLDAG